jgi:hypothetical protein
VYRVFAIERSRWADCVGIIQIRARIWNYIEYQRYLIIHMPAHVPITSPPSNISIWMDSPLHQPFISIWLDSPLHQPLYRIGWIHPYLKPPSLSHHHILTRHDISFQKRHTIHNTAKAMLSHLKHRIYDILILSVLLNQ